MNKIPVTRTIAEAFRFTFAGLEKVIGLIWLPVVTLTIGGYFVTAPLVRGMATAMQTGNLAQEGPMMATIFLFDLVSLVLVSVIAVAIAREILNPLKRPVFLRFALGATEFRLVGALIGLYVLLIVFAVVWVLLSFGLGYLLDSVVPSGAGVAAAGFQRTVAFAVLVGLLLSPVLLYLMLRLSFFVVPSVVMDGKFGIERSWQLSKGNFWRILGITLAIGLPIVAVWVAMEVGVLGWDVLNPHFELIGNKAAQMQHSVEQMQRTSDNLPLLMGLNFLLAPFTNGLLFSAPAFAFKALSEADKT